MTPEQDKALRAPFPSDQIGKLPKPTKRDNPRGRCAECGGYHGLPAVHLDYVGHAAITDRLRQVDREWTWTPMATDERGLPLLDAKGGLWIQLTVADVTRPGYGDETNGKGMKEIIGDALRNAAMRFGVGLDLWSKEDLTSSNGSHPSAGEPQAVDDVTPSSSVSAVSTLAGEQPSPADATAAQKKKLDVLVGQLRGPHLVTSDLYVSVGIHDVDPYRDEDGVPHWSTLREMLSKQQASELIGRLEKYAAKVAEQEAEPVASRKAAS